MSPEQKKGAHGTCPVVRIVADNDQGFTEINEHDFDPKKHELYKEPEVSKAPSEMSVKELKEFLTGKGIEFNKKATREDLLALVPA